MSSSSFGTSFSNDYRIKGEIVGLRMLVYLVNSFFEKTRICCGYFCKIVVCLLYKLVPIDYSGTE